MDIQLIHTVKPDVYLVKNAPADMPLGMIVSGVQRYVDREWPCPMHTHNATRYSVLGMRGRKNRNNFYVRIALS